MKRQIMVLAITIWFISTIQIGWLWPLPYATVALSAAFMSAGIMAFVTRWSTALWYALIQGIVVDLFSPFVFGLYTSCSLVLVISIGLLQDTWLKQHSLLSVATIVGGSLLLCQILLVGAIWLSEYRDIIITETVSHTSIAAYGIGFFTMVIITTMGVRLLTRSYVKFI